MKIMADLDAVHLGLDENEADIAEELQHFDDSFDTRSEASESSESSESEPSISSVSTMHSTTSKNKLAIEDKTKNSEKLAKPIKKVEKKSTIQKRNSTSPIKETTVNGGNTNKKKRPISDIKNKGKKLSVEDPESNITDVKLIVESNEMKKLRKKSADVIQVIANSNVLVTSTDNKSEASDEEANKTKSVAPASYDSDSESEDSDSAANIKRNGRKLTSKSNTPESKTTVINSSSNHGNKSKSVSLYDYKTKLNYLFRDTRFFLIKSNNADNIVLSKNQNVWATLPQNDINLSQAFKEARNILLIFSVNESGKFAGFARMSGPSRRDIPHPPWVLPTTMSTKALGGVIDIDWICRKELSFNGTSHLYNPWNEGKPVKIGRDGQEIEPKVAAELCRLFPEDEKVELTPILRKSKEMAKIMREKGMHVIYKPPKNLLPRGGGRGSNSGSSNYRYVGSDRRDSGGGPLRHKRSFGSGSHRPYKLPHLGPPPPVFKRGGSPYRGGTSSGQSSSSGSRAGGGDSGVPPWERYMTPAAAAEAYLADYMRTMHGQLPPLPFVPPFGQLPLPAPGATSVPPPGTGSIYEQLPPPVRYYDGPPLPDYPPPQTLRPPPPGFDKSGGPSFEDFAAWKHAGLPTGSLPSGFPPSLPGNSIVPGSVPTGGNNNSNNSGSTNQLYRGNRNSSDTTNSNTNRLRERGGRNDYHHRSSIGIGICGTGAGPGAGGSAGVLGSSRIAGGGDRDRHFRSMNERSGRNYRDTRR